MTVTEKAEFKDRVHGWTEKLDARVSSIAVRPMAKKWASYSTSGRVTFDAFLLELREELQDYVIVHELLHFHVSNHGKLWKSLMRAHLGDYEPLEEELQRLETMRRTGRTVIAIPECGSRDVAGRSLRGRPQPGRVSKVE